MVFLGEFGQGAAQQADLRLQQHAGLRQNRLPHQGNQVQNVPAGGPAGVDDEAPVLFRHLGPAHAKAFQSRLVDEGGGKVALRPLEGAAGGGQIQRLLLPAALVQFPHSGGDFLSLALFQSHSIDLSARQAALMHHYLPYTGKTGYSGVTLTKLAIAAAAPGMMTIGVANVSDVLAARAAGTTVTLSDRQTVTLTAGLNDLTLAPLAVGENQTIVFGAPGDTAALLSFEELPTADDLGTVATLGAAASGPADITNGLTDKLAIRTTVTISKEVELTTDIHAAYAAGAAHKISVTGDYVPFAFYQNTRFSGKTITRLELLVRQVNAIDANQTFTVHRVKAAPVYSKQPTTIVESYTRKLPLEQLNGCNPSAVNKR